MRLILIMVRREIALALRRPLFWIYLLATVLFFSLYFVGGVQVAADSGGLGAGEKPHVNGAYSLTLIYMALPFVICTLFAAMAMATCVVRDQQLRVDGVLAATHLSPRGYLAGKLLGNASWALGVAVAGLAAAVVADIITARTAAGGGMDNPELYGAFNLRYHLVPFVCFVIPWLFFAITAAFYLGVRTRSPLAIYGLLAVLYVGLLLFQEASPSFLERWSRDGLGVEWRTLRSWIDPSGILWLLDTYAQEDRGVEFYNNVVPALDLPFIINRVVLMSLGLLALWRAFARFGHSRHGALSAARGTMSTARGASTSEVAWLPEPIRHGSRRGRAAGLLRILRCELALLRRQPAIWVFVPIIWLFSTAAAVTPTGAWNASLILTSRHAAFLLTRSLGIWACAFAAFLTIEVLHRERANRLDEIVRAAPQRTSSLILGKLAAVFVTMILIIAGAAGIVMTIQRQVHGTPVDPLAYAWILGVMLLPGVVFFIALSAFLACVLRGRTSAYAALFGFAILYALGLMTDWLDWRGKVIPADLVVISDITALRPYAEPLLWNRLLVGALSAILLALAIRSFRRDDHPLLERFSWRELRERKPAAVAVLALAALVLAAGIRLDGLMDRGPQAKWREDRAKDYAKHNRRKWGDPNTPLPEYAALDLDVALQPADRRFEVDGRFSVVNRTKATMRELPLTTSLDWEITPEGHIFLVRENGAEIPARVRDRSGLYEIALPEPLEPGGRITLHMRYAGMIHPGTGKKSGGFGTWILEDAVFIDSFGGLSGELFIPVIGFVDPQETIEDSAPEGLDAEELATYWAGKHRAMFGGYSTFDVAVRISVPEGMTALSAGDLVESHTRGGRTIFSYRTDHPVYFFPIMAGRWDTEEAGSCKVYYHPAHAGNVAEIAGTLDRSRRFYSALFGRYPFRELRIAEFPQVASFAMGHPTLIPFSESIGFLTEGDDGISNINFMVTAHETAHQWWGTIVTPARVPGAAFLTEALAHYSTLLMEERFNGRVAARNRRIDLERRYLDGRHADVERPVVRIDGAEPGDQSTWYNKGGLIYWMLSERIGREKFVAVLRRLVEEFSFKEDHPTIHDLLRLVREEAGTDCEPFLQQWFYQVVLPEPRIVSADVAAADGGFVTTMVLENSGTGTADIDVEVAGRKRLSTEIGIQQAPSRFPADTLPDPLGWEKEADGADSAPEDNETTSAPDNPYRAERTHITLGAGETRTLEIATPFKPGYLLLDPDAEQLMAGRTRTGRSL